MVAVVREVVEPTRRIRIPWADWGNWYILRAVIEEGWPSIYSCLQAYTEFQAASRILCRDMPIAVRIVDLAVGQLPPLLRHCLVLRYQCDRDIRGRVIGELQKAVALEMPLTTYKYAIEVGKFMAEREIPRKSLKALELTVESR